MHSVREMNSTTEGVKYLSNSDYISDECLAKLLENIRSFVTDPSSRLNISQALNSKGDVIKETHAALFVFILNNARRKTSPEALVSAIEDFKIPDNKIEKIVKFYKENVNIIRCALGNISTHPPHIVDVTWRLEYCVKANNLEHVGGLLYIIQFQVESCKSDAASPIDEKITFVCTLEELQDLVCKLKEAVKHIERISCK